ncbi:hypothetical protein N8T08_007729 [Aspergillus melleus]|uniref:Uncharacterized protein n=1 Tax=Aspergillus melleus TaxID=138277 RepID=A0ACC3BED7_9EURO|nr:hypothetical protein N8T08_007729 [Aspergillus melleus]
MASSAQDAALHQLQSEQSKLLDAVDELRTIGIGGLVELPQLIVCGNQSSGKSSVLEAISRVRFPARGNVCTRFATEVILRRHQTENVKISIEPGPSRTDEEEKKKLRSFRSDAFANADDLKKLIEKAQQHMGISNSVDSGFSDDVLKVEISGPDKPELTLVDLPGLYYSTSSDQGAQGKEIVRGLTERYMKNTRSIILAVISAKADYHLQEVLNIAEKYDPHRERTLGVITQPDILEADSEEQDTWLQFVKNKKIHLQLGWHTLRNRKFETRKISHEERDQQERDFFNEGRWRSIPRSCVGIESLRGRLSNVLFKHIRRNIPDLIADINEKILDRQQTLAKLGAPRSTLQEQKGFLFNISSGFERITDQALNGMYRDAFFKELDPESKAEDFRRLRAIVRELNENFAEAMEICGCRRVIYGEFQRWPEYSKPSDNNPYLDKWSPIPIPGKALEDEVREQARKNRGVELPGSANQLLVGDLFRDQSKPWEEIARHHLLTTWDSVRYFISMVLQHLTDEHTSSLLAVTIAEPELNKMKEQLLEKLRELTSYTKRGHPLPVGKSFLTRIQNSRNERQLRKLKSALVNSVPNDTGKSFGVKDLERAMSNLDTRGDEFGATEIIEQLQVYYDTAIVTFVDNVATLAIENCLLGPLASIFTSLTINNMEDEQIQELAAEPFFVREERERLNGELEKLQAGLRTFTSFHVYKPSIPLFAKSNAKSSPTSASNSPRESSLNELLNQLNSSPNSTKKQPEKASAVTPAPFGLFMSNDSKGSGNTVKKPSSPSEIASRKVAQPKTPSLFGSHSVARDSDDDSLSSKLPAFASFKPYSDAGDGGLGQRYGVSATGDSSVAGLFGNSPKFGTGLGKYETARYPSTKDQR